MKHTNRGYLVLLIVLIIFILSGVVNSTLISMRLDLENIQLIRAVFQNPGDIDKHNYLWFESLRPAVSQAIACRVDNTQAMIALFQKDYEHLLALTNHLNDESCLNYRLIINWEAQSYYEIGYYSSAVSAWKSIGASIPLQQAGDQLAQQGRWDDALLAYSAVLDLVPGDCVYRTRLGYAFWLGKHDSEKALEQYRLVIKTCSENLDSYIMASRILIDQGYYEAAESLASQAHDKYPSSAAPFNVLALSKLRQNSPNQAKVFIEEALRLSPNDAEPHALLGTAYLALSLPEDAIQEYQIAITIDPQGWYYESLGLAYEQIGDIPSAITAYIKALEFSPEKVDLHRKIQELQNPK